MNLISPTSASDFNEERRFMLKPYDSYQKKKQNDIPK